MSVLVLFRWEGDPDEILAAYDRELKHPVPRKQPRPSFLPLLTLLPVETVWKFGTVPISWSHERAKGGGEAPFRRSVPLNMHRQEALKLFSKQFRKACSRKLVGWCGYRGYYP
jgi:hypothetical protein